jgi:hypothetical protein
MMDYLHLSRADLYRAVADGRAAETIRPWSADMLRAITEGRRALSAAVHPLGFTCLPVLREGRHGVCVHAWLPGQPAARPTTSPVHAHSWDLVSYVLLGRLRNELPHVTHAPDLGAQPDAPSGTQPSTDDLWRVLEIRSRGDTDDIVPTRRLVHCRAGESALNVRDDVYQVPAGTFHSSVADSTEPTVTVVIGSSVPGGADLSLGRPGTQPHRIRRNRRGQAETAALARTIIEEYWRPR